LETSRKIPTHEDDAIVLWESNAILFCMASRSPESGVWPSDLKGQADVLRWPTCQFVNVPASAFNTRLPDSAVVSNSA
jgi:glutathione S-transferase